jgi:hypothetical protein
MAAEPTYPVHLTRAQMRLVLGAVEATKETFTRTWYAGTTPLAPASPEIQAISYNLVLAGDAVATALHKAVTADD